MGQRRKPGRPFRIKKALQYQDNEEFVNSDSEEDITIDKKRKLFKKILMSSW